MNYIVPDVIGLILVTGDYEGHKYYPINVLNGQLRIKTNSHVLDTDIGDALTDGGGKESHDVKFSEIDDEKRKNAVVDIAKNNEQSKSNDFTIASNENNTEDNSGNPIVNASMKETGMHLIILVVLLNILGLIARKK